MANEVTRIIHRCDDANETEKLGKMEIFQTFD